MPQVNHAAHGLTNMGGLLTDTAQEVIRSVTSEGMAPKGNALLEFEILLSIGQARTVDAVNPSEREARRNIDRQNAP